MTPGSERGGTTFHFVNDGIEPAHDQAREAAGDREVRIAGGGATILEYVNAGLIGESSIALSPVLSGTGIRLFEGVDAGRVALEQIRAEPSPTVTHHLLDGQEGAGRIRWPRAARRPWGDNSPGGKRLLRNNVTNHSRSTSV